MNVIDLLEVIDPRALAEARVDRATGIIRNVIVMNAVSANGVNGRVYSETAMRSLARLADGVVAYANHVKTPVDALRPRDIKEIIGRHRNVRFDVSNARVVGDFHVLPAHTWVLDLADHLSDRVGFSPVSRGAVRVDASGKEIVEDIVALRSVDLVSDPATTKGLFEHREDTMNQAAKARAAIAAHPLGQRYGGIPAAVSEVFVGQLVEAAESRWPALLDERLKMLDGTTRPAPATSRVVHEGGDERRTDVHARMRAAFLGVPFIDVAVGPTPRELQEAAERKQRLRERDELVSVPATAHRDLAEALTGQQSSNVPADAHEKMRRALGGR